MYSSPSAFVTVFPPELYYQANLGNKESQWILKKLAACSIMKMQIKATPASNLFKKCIHQPKAREPPGFVHISLPVLPPTATLLNHSHPQVTDKGSRVGESSFP